MTIGRKLMTASLSVLALALAVAGVMSYLTQDLGQALKQALGSSAKQQVLAGEIKASAAQAMGAENELLYWFVTQETARLEGSKQKFATAAGRVEQSIEQLDTLTDGVERQQALDRARVALAETRQAHEALLRNLGSQDIQAIQQASNVVLSRGSELLAQAARIAEASQKELDTLASSADSRVSMSTLVGILALILVGGAGAFCVFVIRGVSASLRRAAAEMALNAEQVASASGQVASASQSLARGASEQAASLEETSASAQEIGSMTTKNAENARTVSDLMQQTESVVKNVNRAIEGMVSSMTGISDATDKVSKIIKLIDEIAFQTNILALNAAVEAARAGEAGMGFAVVADEVRNLAQRCTQAARDTTELIELAVTSTSEGKTRLAEVTKAMAANTEIAARVKTLVDEVNLGSQEQTRGMDEISRAISQMEQVTQRTAASAEESASASEQLTAQSETMRHLSGNLKAMVEQDGAGADLAGPRRPSPASVARKPLEALQKVVVKAKPPVKPGIRTSSAASSLPLTHEEAHAGARSDFQDF